MSETNDDTARIDRLLGDIQAKVDQLAGIPSDHFSRGHRRSLTRIRSGLRTVGAKLPPKRTVKGRPEAEEAAEKGRQAYELREQNLPWKAVMEITGVVGTRGNRMHKAMEWARRHAERNGLPWPVGPAAPGLRHRDDA